MKKDTEINESKNNMIIAIDGHSSCGKSTIAKDMANALAYLYIDTGAMYRAVTLWMIEQEIELDDKEGIDEMLDQLKLEFKLFEGQQFLYMNGRMVEEKIRTPEIASMVSPVSEISAIRKKLVELQREMATKGCGVILEGRDIGTVVFPEADLKIFVTADIGKRTQRRYLELINKGIDISIEEVHKNLAERDRIDSSRRDSPLKMADDAILLDTSYHSRESQLEAALKLVKEHPCEQ